MLIRPRTDDDLPACGDLLLAVQRADGYPVRRLEDPLDFLCPPAEELAWVAEAGGRVVGHVALHGAVGGPGVDVAREATGLPPEQLVVLSRLFTDPAVRGTGTGRALLRHATAHAADLGRRAVLDVGPAMTAPKALYASEGWSAVGEALLVLDDGTRIPLEVLVSPQAWPSSQP